MKSRENDERMKFNNFASYFVNLTLPMLVFFHLISILLLLLLSLPKQLWLMLPFSCLRYCPTVPPQWCCQVACKHLFDCCYFSQPLVLLFSPVDASLLLLSLCYPCARQKQLLPMLSHLQWNTHPIAFCCCVCIIVLLQCHPWLIVTYYVNFLLCCCVHCHRLLCCAVASATDVSCCPQGWLLLLSILPTLSHTAQHQLLLPLCHKPVHFLACAALLLWLLPVNYCFLISPVTIVTAHCNVTAHAPVHGNIVAINPIAIAIVLLVSLTLNCCLSTNHRIFCHRLCCHCHFLCTSSCCQCCWKCAIKMVPSILCCHADSCCLVLLLCLLLGVAVSVAVTKSTASWLLLFTGFIVGPFICLFCCWLLPLPLPLPLPSTPVTGWLLLFRLFLWFSNTAVAVSNCSWQCLLPKPF